MLVEKEQKKKITMECFSGRQGKSCHRVASLTMWSCLDEQLQYSQGRIAAKAFLLAAKVARDGADEEK